MSRVKIAHFIDVIQQIYHIKMSQEDQFAYLRELHASISGPTRRRLRTPEAKHPKPRLHRPKPKVSEIDDNGNETPVDDDYISFRSAEDPPSDNPEYEYHPKVAKSNRKMTISKDGTATVTEDLEESKLDHERKVIAKQLRAKKELKKYDVLQDITRRNIDMQAEQQKYAHDQAVLEHQRNVDQQRYAHDQAMLEQQLNAERAAKALDADNARMKRDLDFRDVVERNQHEEQMQQNDLGTKITLKSIDAKQNMFAQQMASNDNYHKLNTQRNIEKMKLQAGLMHDQGSWHHDERMCALKNIDKIADANEKVAEGRHRRMMNAKQHHEEIQQQAWSRVKTATVRAAQIIENDLIDLMEKFDLPGSTIHDLETPRQVSKRLFEKTTSRYYAYSILFTGVTKMEPYNPFNPYVILNDGHRLSLPHGIDGYECFANRVANSTFVVDVYKYTLDQVRSSHKFEYFMYLSRCCNNRCDVA